MKKREVPKKNYLIFLVLSVFIVCLCFYLATWYKTLNEYYKNNSVIVEVLSEIEANSFSSFLLDNPDILVYISSSKDSEVKSFEKKIKKFIIDNNLSSEIVYFDVSKEENSLGLMMLKENYLSQKLSKLKEIKHPNLVKIEDGVIVDILYTKKTAINKIDVEKFLKRNELLEND